jgi:hypothetical protein
MFRVLCILAGCSLTLPLAGGDKKLPLVFEDDFKKGAGRWAPTDPEAWRVERDAKGSVYHQFQLSKYKPPQRSPLNISLVKGLTLTDFVLEAEVLSTAKDGAHRDMCLFFGHQGPDQFYYAHMAKSADDHANQVFLVNKADRTKISKTTSKGTPWDDSWHHVKLVRRPGDGAIEVYFDDMKTPVMTAQDKTFAWGRVGVGSFDDTGKWDDVRIWGEKK